MNGHRRVSGNARPAHRSHPPTVMKSAILQSILVLCSSSMLFAAPLGSAFIYQGRLTHGTGAANGLYEMEFTLHDAATNGTQIGPAVSLAPVAVSNGVFTAFLDF